MDKISVVIPTHNRPKELKRAIDSLINQTSLPDEIIVVDDGSVEPVTKHIFKNLPPSVRGVLLTNKTAKGACHARNRGIEAATGKYIAFLDDDDLFTKNKIYTLKQHIKKHPKIDVFHHSATINMVNEGVSYKSGTRPLCKDPEKKLKQFIIGNPVGGTSLVTVKKQCLLDVGLFDESFPAQQDKELWTRLAKNNKKFYFIDEPLTEYHHVTESTSISKSIDNYRASVNLFNKKYHKEIEELSRNEKRQLAESVENSVVHRYLLNGDLFKAIRHQITVIKVQPSFRNFIFLFVLLGGRRFVFKVRSWIG